MGSLPENTLLVTLDGSSLYTNIPHGEGISACCDALATRCTHEPPIDDLLCLISCILKKINFVFGDRNFVQIHGTAIGTCMAPSYANLFMAKLDHDFLSRPNTMQPNVWWRYIDDIFAIWGHGERELKHFIDELNSFHPTIKFTANWSFSEVNFLDTIVIFYFYFYIYIYFFILLCFHCFFHIHFPPAFFVR